LQQHVPTAAALDPARDIFNGEDKASDCLLAILHGRHMPLNELAGARRGGEMRDGVGIALLDAVMDRVKGVDDQMSVDQPEDRSAQANQAASAHGC
jgi:hypothetical protein